MLGISHCCIVAQSDSVSTYAQPVHTYRSNTLPTACMSHLPSRGVFQAPTLALSGDRVEQDLRVAIVQLRSWEEVGADHLQTVTARFVRAQHQGCRLDRLLDDGNLALIDFEVDQLQTAPFPSPSVPSSPPA